MQPFFFFSFVRAKWWLMVPGVPSGDREKWGWVPRRDENHAWKSLGKITAKDVELFRNGSVHKFYRLKALIPLEPVSASVVEKKKNLKWVKLRCWGSVNFHNMQISIVMSMRFIFGDDWNDAPCSARFAENDVKSKYPEDCSTVNKKGMENL